jgi:hypothetical protein
MGWNKPTGNSSLTLGSVISKGIISQIMRKILNLNYFLNSGFGMVIANYRIEKKISQDGKQGHEFTYEEK